MTTHVALLRGINLGAKNKVPMPALRDYVEAAGGANARTYLQSGNVVFEALDDQAPNIGAAISDRLRDDLGLTVPVVLIRADELGAITAANPFLRDGRPESQLHLMVLSAEPTGERIAKLDPDRSAPDAFVVAGRAIYLHLPSGVARSKLTNDYFDRTLGVVSTNRNWRTVGKLLELSDATG